MANNCGHYEDETHEALCTLDPQGDAMSYSLDLHAGVRIAELGCFPDLREAEGRAHPRGRRDLRRRRAHLKQRIKTRALLDCITRVE